MVIWYYSLVLALALASLSNPSPLTPLFSSLIFSNSYSLYLLLLFCVWWLLARTCLIPWHKVSQDQIVFPDEAVFEKVYRFVSNCLAFINVVCLSILLILSSFTPGLFRLISHQEGYTFWSSIVTTGSSCFGCRSDSLFLFFSFRLLCIISWPLIVRFWHVILQFGSRNLMLTVTHNYVAQLTTTSIDH